MKNPLRSGARKLNCFVDDLTGSRFYLLRGITLRAGRGVRLLSTVIHFFYKFLYHLALHGGGCRTFFVFVLFSVWLFSNVWNRCHLPIASHRETYFRHRNVSHGETYLCFPRRCCDQAVQLCVPRNRVDEWHDTPAHAKQTVTRLGVRDVAQLRIGDMQQLG